MAIYVVMLEQHFANHVDLKGAFLTMAEALAYIRTESWTPDDCTLYECNGSDTRFIRREDWPPPPAAEAG